MNYGWLAACVLIGGSLTFLYPCFAALAGLVLGATPRLKPRKEIEIDILIPTYNEADTIERTLESVVKARQRLLEVDPTANVQITVGLDGSQEPTRKAVIRFCEAHLEICPIKIQDRKDNKGKWITLHELVSSSSADWCALVDAGTLWPENFLVTVASYLHEGRYIGLAPGYDQGNAGIAERLVWGLERTLKRIENLAGGPCSLHGATTIFDREALQAAFKEVSYRSWLNDDVVLALTLRKKGQIYYFGKTLEVSDCGVRESVGEQRRRARILVGNMEWITEIFPKTLKESPLAALVALRRVARTFWAYHIVLGALAFCFAFDGAVWAVAMSVLGLLGFISNKRLRDALVVSLSGPRYMTKNGRRVSWV